MSDEKAIAFPCIGLAKQGDYYHVAIREDNSFYSFSSDTARHIATDLLMWADRVEKLNSGDKE